MAKLNGISVERATVILQAAHTTPIMAGKVFDLVQPRMAGLWHTSLTADIAPLIFEDLRATYDGPVVQTQDLTVFNITKDAVVARQAQVTSQPMAVAGAPRTRGCTSRASRAAMVGRSAHTAGRRAGHGAIVTELAQSTVRMFGLGLVGAAVLLGIAPAQALAHKPLMLPTGSSSRTVKDASVSYAAYGRFVRAGERVVIRGPLKRNDTLIADLLIPDAAPESRLAQSMLPTLQVVDPSGALRTVKRLATADPFDEPFTRTKYLTVAKLEDKASQAGTYLWIVTSHGPGRFVVALGKREQFGVSDVAKLPGTIEKVRSWAGAGGSQVHPHGNAAHSSPTLGEFGIGAASAFTRMLVVTALLMAVAATVGIATRDNSYIDLFWGPTIATAGVAALSAMPSLTTRATVIGLMMVVWATRLALHLAVRKARMPGEDPRYAAWRRQWGRTWVVRSILQVYVLQGALAMVVALPALVVSSDWSGGADAWLVIGAAVWAAGLCFEAIADWQLARFLARKRAGLKSAHLYTGGLWSISRHPNYFGESLVWCGIGIAALGAAYGWLALISPIVITLLVRWVSGVPMLNAPGRARPGFAEWSASTPVFVPWPRWGGRRRAGTQ